MDNFIFSINATLPIFLTMILRLFFRKIGVFDDAFTNKMNSFVFKFALPALLFEDLWEERNTQLQCRYVDNIVIGIYPDRLAVCTKNVLINLK